MGVTGKVTTLFEDETLLTKALNGTESSLEITISQNLDWVTARLDYAGGNQLFWSYLASWRKAIQFTEIYRAVLGAEDIDKATLLRQALYYRQLPTLKARPHPITGTGLLPLTASSGVGAMAATITSAYSLAAFFRAFIWF